MEKCLNARVRLLEFFNDQESRAPEIRAITSRTYVWSTWITIQLAEQYDALQLHDGNEWKSALRWYCFAYMLATNSCLIPERTHSHLIQDTCECAIESYTNTCYSLFVVCRPCACRSLRMYRSSIESLYSVIVILCDWRARHRSQSIRNLFWIMMESNCIRCIHVRQLDNDDNSLNRSFVSILALVWRSVWIFRRNLIAAYLSSS